MQCPSLYDNCQQEHFIEQHFLSNDVHNSLIRKSGFAPTYKYIATYPYVHIARKCRISGKETVLCIFV